MLCSAKVVAALFHCEHEATAAAVRKEVQPLLKSGGLEETKHLFEKSKDGEKPASEKPVKAENGKSPKKKKKSSKRTPA